MDAQINSEELNQMSKLESEFTHADGYIHGIADLLFNMTMSCDNNLSQMDHNSLNSLMYQCMQQADKCNEAFQGLLKICYSQQERIAMYEK